MSEYLSREELEALRRWPTCAISNAIELFSVRPR
ncbi:MAG: RraA family protein, partial [Proteobacteria bacterium]|nr:RraA family protein [Pseudomonadota bacterium]